MVRAEGDAMSDRIPVLVTAFDPISLAGITSQLRYRPEINLIEDVRTDTPTVTIVVADRINEDAIRVIRAAARGGRGRVLVVATQIDDNDLLQAVEAGSCGLIRRNDASPERLVAAIQAASSGDGTVPPDLLGRLLDQVARLQRQTLTPRGLTFSGFAERELEVLKLVADGMSTIEIARQLAYSERTVKNIIRDVTARLHLKNRAHAVAYVVREGLV
jgi:DNA-binding NarL/FixJ family response regulator